MATSEITEKWYSRLHDGLRERTSAGGVVVRLDRGIVYVALVREIDAFGNELNGYVLPKGGVEEGESMDDAMIREIEEEAGLTEVAKLADLAVLERMDLQLEYWSINHYGLFYTTQLEGEIKDKEHHFGFGWFHLDELPDLFWPDERTLIEKNRNRIYDLVIQHQNPKPRKERFV